MRAAPETLVWPPRYDPLVPAGADDPFWNRTRETMSSDERDAVILAKIQRRHAYAWERAPFYRTRWTASGSRARRRAHPSMTSRRSRRSPKPTCAPIRPNIRPSVPTLCIDPRRRRARPRHLGDERPSDRVRVERRRHGAIGEAHARDHVELRDPPARCRLHRLDLLALRRLVGRAARDRTARRRGVSVRRGRRRDRRSRR